MTSSTAPLQAFFMDGARGQRFCLLYIPPDGKAALGHVVYVHPFAEELNASRRMAALQARALARAGFAVLQMDLMGCGDSSGHFEEASWDIWLDDVTRARDWMAEHWPGVTWLWGLRAGCLLAAQACRLSAGPSKLLLWQPVMSGKQHLNQFLRMQMAGDIARGEPNRGTSRLMHLLEQGESVEVAGYSISAALAQGMAQADLNGLPVGTPVVSLELGNPDTGHVSPALAAQLQRWQDAGCSVMAHGVSGTAFWQMQECPDSPTWVAASLRAMNAAPTEVPF